MFKKILTTKPHLVVLFLGVIHIVFSKFVWIRVGTWDLNRTIGWGWDHTNFLMYESSFQFFSFCIIFPLVYWICVRRGVLFEMYLVLLQVVVILLHLYCRITWNVSWAVIFFIGSWLLFGVILLTRKKLTEN